MEYTAKQVNNIVANIHNQLMATAPPQRLGESDEAYRQRAMRDTIKKMR